MLLLIITGVGIVGAHYVLGTSVSAGSRSTCGL